MKIHWVRLIDNLVKLEQKNKKKEMDSPVAHQNLDNEIKSSCEHIEELEKIANKFQEEAKTKIKIKDKKGAQTTLIKKKRYVKQINNYRGDLKLLEQKNFIN